MVASDELKLLYSEFLKSKKSKDVLASFVLSFGYDVAYELLQRYTEKEIITDESGRLKSHVFVLVRPEYPDRELDCFFLHELRPSDGEEPVLLYIHISDNIDPRALESEKYPNYSEKKFLQKLFDNFIKNSLFEDYGYIDILSLYKSSLEVVHNIESGLVISVKEIPGKKNDLRLLNLPLLYSGVYANSHEPFYIMVGHRNVNDCIDRSTGRVLPEYILNLNVECLMYLSLEYAMNSMMVARNLDYDSPFFDTARNFIQKYIDVPYDEHEKNMDEYVTKESINPFTKIESICAAAKTPIDSSHQSEQLSLLDNYHQLINYYPNEKYVIMVMYNHITSSAYYKDLFCVVRVVADNSIYFLHPFMQDENDLDYYISIEKNNNTLRIQDSVRAFKGYEYFTLKLLSVGYDEDRSSPSVGEYEGLPVSCFRFYHRGLGKSYYCVKYDRKYYFLNDPDILKDFDMTIVSKHTFFHFMYSQVLTDKIYKPRLRGVASGLA